MQKISVCVPTHEMQNGEFFLNRLKESLENQTYQNYELVITKEGRMAENTNAAIKRATGDIIKVLYMDDYLAHPNALWNIANSSMGGWLASACLHDDGTGLKNPHTPFYEENVSFGQNTVGSPSVVAFINDNPPLFDENMTWLLDVDLYRRFYRKWGKPTLLESFDVVMGLGPHQMTNILSNEAKQQEVAYLSEKLRIEHGTH